MKIIKLILGASILLLSVQVNASLIEQDLYSINDGLVTFDTNTGLEWLDVNETLGHSYNSVYAAGGLNETGGLTHSYNVLAGESLLAGDSTFNGPTALTIKVSPIPVPAAVWLFGTALIGLPGFGNRRKAA